MVVNFGRRGRGCTRSKLRVGQRIKRPPRERRLRQAAIVAMDIEPDRPELVVMALAHLHFRHPIKDFARIEVAKNAALEFEQKRRMNRVGEIEQNVRPGQSIAQFALAKFRCSAWLARSCSWLAGS